MATHDATRSPSAAPGRMFGGAAQRLTTETKNAFKTSEFWTFVAVTIAILIAGNAIEIEEGGTDYFAADKVWLYVTVLAVGYMLSRGLAKSGSREPYYRDGTNAERDGSAHDGS